MLVQSPDGTSLFVNPSPLAESRVPSSIEDVTITGNRTLANGKRKSIECVRKRAANIALTRGVLQGTSAARPLESNH